MIVAVTKVVTVDGRTELFSTRLSILYCFFMMSFDNCLHKRYTLLEN